MSRFGGLLDGDAVPPQFPAGGRDLAPITVVLLGTLQPILRGAGYLETEFQANRDSVIQGIRYYCADPQWARLVQVQLEFPSGLLEVLTPSGTPDVWQLWRPIGSTQRFKVRLNLGLGVTPGAIPVSADSTSVRLEVFG